MQENNPEYTVQQLEKMTDRISSLYKECRKRMNYCQRAALIEENKDAYEQDLKVVAYVDCCLETCSKDTQKIIRSDYLEVSDPKWYMEYYSATGYYRRKQKAIEC